MPASFWYIVNKVLKESDILLEVLDARHVEQTRNMEIEDKVIKRRKPLIFVLNKCDLSNKNDMEAWKAKLKHSVFVSATQKLGTTILMHEIIRTAKTFYKKKEKVIIGVIGYPNTGKSSVINSLVGRKSAKTSSISGYTKAKQLIKLTGNIYLMDTPGVFPYKEDDELKKITVGSVDIGKVKEPDLVAMDIIKRMGGKIEEFYGVEKADPGAVLESIAVKMNRLKKGGRPDTYTVSKKIIQDVQKGKVK